MDAILLGILGVLCVCYNDDLLVTGKTLGGAHGKPGDGTAESKAVWSGIKTEKCYFLQSQVYRVPVSCVRTSTSRDRVLSKVL